jgi:aryl-alcohol dehydrogenase-like predicted oxidoreductase
MSPARKKKIVEQTKRDKEFYVEIWDSRWHICGCCLKSLPDEPRSFNFDHILPKASFRKLRYEKDNIALICLECHQIKNIGVCNYSVKKMICAWEVLQKSGIRLFSNQVKYNLLDREIENNGLLEVSKELGIAIIAHSPLELGILTGKFHKHPELLDNIGERKRSYWFKPEGIKKSEPVIKVIENLCKKYNVTASQVALSWLIHHKSVFAIPGATTGQQAIENAVAMKFKMSEKDYKLLDGLK